MVRLSDSVMRKLILPIRHIRHPSAIYPPSIRHLLFEAYSLCYNEGASANDLAG